MEPAGDPCGWWIGVGMVVFEGVAWVDSITRLLVTATTETGLTAGVDVTAVADPPG
jgi:hypothetical protein